MITYIFLKRLPLAFGVVIISTLVTFTLLCIAPGDPAEIIIQRLLVGDTEYRPSEEEKEAVRDMFNLRDPIFIAYFKWLIKALSGDFGISYRTGLPVLKELNQRLFATFALAVASMAIATFIGILIGAFAVMKRSLNVLASIYFAFFVSTPSFLLALLFLVIFVVKLKTFPMVGYSGFSSLILPSLSLAIPTSAIITQLVRTNLLEAMSQDFITTARTKGLDEKVILLRHGLRNALIPVVTILGLQFGGLLSGVVVVENIFSWPGIGTLLVDAVQARDVPVIQACVFVIAVIYSAVNLAVDLLYGLIDPRVRLR